MKKSERAKLVSKILNEYYPETPVPLEHSSCIYIANCGSLSAQCTDERVNKVTPYLFKLASSPEACPKFHNRNIYEIIKPCGLGPKKSSAILELSNILVDKFSGKIPKI